MTKEEEFELMKIVIQNLEKRVNELEKGQRLGYPKQDLMEWQSLKKQAKENTPYYLKTATI